MKKASFRVLHAGPTVSFQDGGRPGHMRFGVTRSGPMDRLSFSAANLAVGNEQLETAIEISIGGLKLECVSGMLTLAILGEGFSVTLDDQAFEANVVLTIKAGQVLSILPGRLGSWCYLAFAGQLSVPKWLGHTATHAISGFGGGVLNVGEEFDVSDAEIKPNREGPIELFEYRKFSGYLRVVLGPQDHLFSSKSVRNFLSREFALTDAYDRMGVKLNGPELDVQGALSIPSEPIVRGSVQVSGDGVPTVLLSDHQTTGGYPKIATVISADIDCFTQLRPRDKFYFQAVDPESAIVLARTREIEIQSYFAELKR